MALFLTVYSPSGTRLCKHGMDDLENKVASLVIWSLLSFLFSTTAMIGSMMAYVRANEVKDYFSGEGHKVYGRMANSSSVMDDDEETLEEQVVFSGTN